MNDFVQACARRQDAILDLTRELARIESPSGDVAALDRCATRLVAALEEAGALVARPRPDSSVAAHVVASWSGAGPRVLLLGHFDTVYPIGQIGRQPVEERNGRLFGPGVYDMKAGLAIAVHAIAAVQQVLPESHRPCISLLATADEEVGSVASRGLIESMGRESAAVLVLEPALASGAIKTARKGVAEFDIEVRGVPAHAGVAPDAGASAIEALAQIVSELAALRDPASGRTVNVGVISGGTRANVVAEHARASVDVRLARLDDGPVVERAFAALRAHDSRVTVTVTGGVNRPPMERTAGVVKLYELARAVAAGHGWALEEGATGGGSDGNFTAALGVPTLDGLGAVGDGAHAAHEHVIIKDLAVRAALVAGLLGRLCDNEAGELTRR